MQAAYYKVYRFVCFVMSGLMALWAAWLLATPGYNGEFIFLLVVGLSVLMAWSGWRGRNR